MPSRRPVPRARPAAADAMVSHSGLITVMDRAARKAAPRLRRDFNEVQHLQVSRKGPADFVSMADQRAEQTLFEELSRARPDWGFIMEERGEVEGDPAKIGRASCRERVCQYV